LPAGPTTSPPHTSDTIAASAPIVNPMPLGLVIQASWNPPDARKYSRPPASTVVTAAISK
jgi:hypothetical protein